MDIEISVHTGCGKRVGGKQKAAARAEPRQAALLIEFPRTIRNQAIHSLTLFGWSKYDRENSPKMEFLKTSSIERHLSRRHGNAPQSKEEAAWDSLLEKYQFRRSDKFDLALMKYADSMILNADENFGGSPHAARSATHGRAIRDV
jgi:hypothetical protein